MLSIESNTIVYEPLLMTAKNSRADRRFIMSFAESQIEGLETLQKINSVARNTTQNICVPMLFWLDYFISKLLKQNGFSNTETSVLIFSS